MKRAFRYDDKDFEELIPDPEDSEGENSAIDFMENYQNCSVTENGALGYATSGHSLVDLNFMVSSLRSREEEFIVKNFIKAYYESPEYAVKWLFFLRDISQGLGERRTFRICMKYMADSHREIAAAVMGLIPEYGRYDDLLIFLDTDLKKEVCGLLKKQLDKHGLTADQLVLEDDALRGIIRHYTREAGVRGLERQIGKICRKAARQILEDHAATVVVGERDLEEYLGKEKMEFDTINEQDEVGIVRGLAWTSVGGDTLQIEVNVMPGKGNMQLTGQMGDVMKESAQIALSYIRSIASRYQVAGDFFETHDLHIHIPEGAVPKDGPSAGITMATAMLSAVTGRKVRREVAMTGEITLRGKVLPIGGLKEKLLVAKMAGVKTVLVPEKNRTSVEEISREITDGLRIVFVSDMDEVIGEAFLEVGE